MNEFIEPIYTKKKYDFFGWLKYKLYIRKLKKTSPDFKMLWEIANFCKILETVYMYPNNNTCKLYSSAKQAPNRNSFIYKGENFSIIVDLDKDTSFISITIDRSTGNKIKSAFKFYDGEATIETADDRQMFINIIDWIMGSVVELVEEYYNKQVAQSNISDIPIENG